MAKYTTQLRSVVEAGVPLFDFDYPIFDEKYRSVLEQKIIDRYYFREIGLETVGQFKHFLKMKMNEIMPYYNELYKSVGLVTADDYWSNLNSVEKHTKTVTQVASGKANTDSTTTASGKTTDIFSDTPQAKLSGLDYATNMNDGETDTTATESGESTSDTTATTTEEYLIETSGGGGMRYNADILMEWRKSFINVDVQVLDDLNVLFMNIY